MILVEQLKEIYRHCMRVKHPNEMGIYSILKNQFMPLVEGNRVLADLFYEKARDERTGCRRIRQCLEDESWRSQWLKNPDPTMFTNFKDEVCNALVQMISIAQSIPPTSNRGRTPSLLFNEKEEGYQLGKRPILAFCKIPPNSYMFILSQKMMHKSVQVGDSKSWVDLYKMIYSEEPTSNDQWTKIDQIVRLIANKLEKKGIPCPLQFDGGKDGRVTRIL